MNKFEHVVGPRRDSPMVKMGVGVSEAMGSLFGGGRGGLVIVGCPCE